MEEKKTPMFQFLIFLLKSWLSPSTMFRFNILCMAHVARYCLNKTEVP